MPSCSIISAIYYHLTAVWRLFRDRWINISSLSRSPPLSTQRAPDVWMVSSRFSLHRAFSALDFNLTFPPPHPPSFVWLLFCNSCYYRFWSAVIAGGKIGPDGVLLCMNGALAEPGLNRPSLNGVYAPPACLSCGVHITVAWSVSALVESDGKVESWGGFFFPPYLLIFHALTE